MGGDNGKQRRSVLSEKPSTQRAREVVVTPSSPCTALSTFSNFSLVLFGPNFRGKLFDHRLRIELRTRHRMSFVLTPPNSAQLEGGLLAADELAERVPFIPGATCMQVAAYVPHKRERGR